jgi:hypothetical protein
MSRRRLKRAQRVQRWQTAAHGEFPCTVAPYKS